MRALHLIEEMGSHLGLLINFHKSELSAEMVTRFLQPLVSPPPYPTWISLELLLVILCIALAFLRSFLKSPAKSYF